MPEFSEIRNPINKQNLEQYLTNIPESAIIGLRIPKFSVPLTIKQFTFGQSNPTYFVVDSLGAKYVLRRKPTANSKLISKSAHAIEREFFILKGIAEFNEEAALEKKVPVPEVFFLCEDESVLGAVFYMMEYVEGRTLKEPEMLEIPKEKQHAYWKAIMTTISAIHSVDCSKLIKNLPAKHFPQFQPKVLAKLEIKGTYFQRQLKTLSAVENSQAKLVDTIPNFKEITDWVLKHSPKDPGNMTLIHGDCKIDNFLFHESKPQVVAVLDWELCTIGHPIFDLANFLQPYILPKSLNQIILPHTTIGIEDPASAPFVQKVLELYEKLLGQEWRNGEAAANNPRDLWMLGSVFGILRLCVISQGVAMRVKRGTASSASATTIGELYKGLSLLALKIIERDSKL